MKKTIQLLFLFALFIFVFGQVNAQPFTLEDHIKPVKLELHKFNPSKEPKAKGRLGVAQITQVKDTMYFWAGGISIYSPVYVGVNVADPSNTVEVRLHKMNWKEASRSGSTDNKGHWEEKFKTENDFGIMVIAKSKPVTYSIVTWAGDESKFELPTVFKKDDGSGGGVEGNFFKDNMLYIIIGVLVLAILVMFLKLKSRKK
jgi:hypothetical protein